jgi:L-fuculose-phosphate aldolase
MGKDMQSIDLSGLKVITLSDIEAATQKGATEVVTAPGAVLTPSAKEALQARGIATRSGSVVPLPKDAIAPVDARIAALFDSAEARAVKEEICAVGRKLWMRSYVDGNGGNISYRIGPDEVICTPTLCSKYDLKPEELCMVDLTGKQLAGGRPRTSEILMHLEIYKAVPEAKAVVHCHPPHATAYAIVGKVPPTCIIPEYEVFIGKVALSPYETPGSPEFARTVIPFVKDHNTVLLSNHGIVCWGDTVTHAEWYAEVTDTYCWTLMNASRLGTPMTHIPDAKAADLVAIKKRLGLPDPRHDMKECQLCDLPDTPGGIAITPKPCIADAGTSDMSASEVEALVQMVTDEVMKALEKKGR